MKWLPPRSKTVLRVRNKLLTDIKEKLKQEENQENVPSACVNSTLKVSELNSAIRNLKPKKAPGPDGVSNDMLKHLGSIARKTLLVIFNHRWNKRLAPQVWKKAYLVSVLKKGKEKTSPGSYGPISLLSCVEKLTESIITHRLTWFLETSNVVSPSQTGCHQHHIIEDQFALLTQDI